MNFTRLYVSLYYLKKLINFLVFFCSICFWMPFLFFLNFLWRLWKFRVHNSCSSCLVISMGNFFIRVVSGILPAMFFVFSVSVIQKSMNGAAEIRFKKSCDNARARKTIFMQFLKKITKFGVQLSSVINFSFNYHYKCIYQSLLFTFF